MHFKRASKRLAFIFELGGGVFLLAMMLITVSDVLLRAINPMWRMYGVVELVQLLFDWMIFLGIPAVFLLGTNLTVNLFDDRLGARTMLFLKRTAGLVSALFLLMLIKEALVPALDTLRYGDETQDLRLPLIVYWLPILVGLSVALLASLRDLILPKSMPELEQTMDA